MTLPLFYASGLGEAQSLGDDIDQHFFSDDGFTFLIKSSNLFQHIFLSTRKNVGDHIILTDGLDFAGIFEITKISKEKKEFTVDLYRELTFPNSGFIFTAFVPALKDKGYVLAADLLVQAGVDFIVPFNAERSISKWNESKINKVLNQMIASAEQSRRLEIPDIEESTPTDYLEDSQARVLVLHTSNNNYDLSSVQDAISLKEAAQKIKKSNVRDIVIIIGPEGGLTDNEISKFKKSGAEIVDLGSTIYRASFAGAAAVIELKTLLDLDF